MNTFSILTLPSGLEFFIYGMNQMSHSLEIIAGEKMEIIINLQKVEDEPCGDDSFHCGIF